MADVGYRATLPRSVVARIMPQGPSPGAIVARGMIQLGQTVDAIQQGDRAVDRQIADSDFRIAQIEQGRARATAVADGMGRFAEFQLQTQTRVQELRDQAAPGGADHARQAEALYRERAREFLSTLPNDPEVREHFAPMVARWEAGAIGDEREWERERRVTHMGEQFGVSLDASAAALFSKPDADSFAALLGDFDNAIALQTVDGTAKQTLRGRVRETLTAALLDGMLAQGGYEAVEQVLASGRFDGWIGGAEGKARWQGRAGAERAAAVRAEEAAAAQSRRTAIDALDTIKALIDAGEDVPQADIESALAAGRAAGVDQADMIRFADLGRQAVERASARGMQTPELQADLQQLQQRRAAGQASADDLRRMGTLERELDGRDAQAGTSIRELARSGAPGRVAAAGQLAAMPVDRRWAAGREAGDTRLAVYAGLTPRGREYAAEGRALREERPDDFLPAQPERRGRGGAATGREQADAMFRQMLGPDLVDQLGETYREHLDTALDVMAGAARRWDEQSFRRAVQMAFGQTRRPDGTWQGGIGGINGRRVELPSQWTATEFARAYSAMDFGNARYGDGSRVNAADVRRSFTPRYIGDDKGSSRYLLVGPDGRQLGHANGGPFVLVVPERP